MPVPLTTHRTGPGKTSERRVNGESVRLQSSIIKSQLKPRRAPRGP